MDNSLSVAVASTVSSSLVVPRAFPHLNYDFVNTHVSQTSPLALMLDECDIHMHSTTHNLGALDFDVAATIWSTIKRIGRTIILAANPGMATSDIKPYIPAARLAEIEMPAPVIIQAYAFTQNPCHLVGTPEDIIARFQYIQNVGIEGLRWLMHARARCAIYDNDWDWRTMPTQTFAAHHALSHGRTIQPSEDRLLELFRAENLERALILHPTMSNAARATREADYISLPEDDSYPMSQDEADEEYSPQSPIFRSPSTTPDNSPTPSLFETEYDAYSNYATYGADSNHDGEDFARSMSPLDMGMSAFGGVNYMEGDSREIIDLTYDTDEDSLMSDE